MAKAKILSFDKLKNVVREPNVVELKPWKSIHDTIIEPMLTGMGNIEIPESHLAMGFARITQPETLGAPTHKHPHDQWIYLIGEPQHFHEFDADVEMRLGDKIVKVNYPCYIFIPKNVMHCPLVVKRVGKPFIFIDARISEEASVRPATIKKHPPIKYIAHNKKK
ncbi:MAG: hypothetical protein JW845_01800 [Dehalococcoidales bacterium]|nr:hypothetical protein [Dehalococcoidales bacterium]